MPSWMGEMEMLAAPMSITRAEGLPAEKLLRESHVSGGVVMEVFH